MECWWKCASQRVKAEISEIRRSTEQPADLYTSGLAPLDPDRSCVGHLTPGLPVVCHSAATCCCYFLQFGWMFSCFKYSCIHSLNSVTISLICFPIFLYWQVKGVYIVYKLSTGSCHTLCVIKVLSENWYQVTFIWFLAVHHLHTFLLCRNGLTAVCSSFLWISWWLSDQCGNCKFYLLVQGKDHINFMLVFQKSDFNHDLTTSLCRWMHSCSSIKVAWTLIVFWLLIQVQEHILTSIVNVVTQVVYAAQVNPELAYFQNV